jgi:hypothetical protein
MSDTTTQNLDGQPVETAQPSELEVLKAKYEQAQRDIQKFKVRDEEVKAAQKARDEEEFKKKSLEEQLEAFKTRETEASTKLEQLQAQLSTESRKMQMLEAGISKDYVSKALKLSDDSYFTDDGFDAEKFLTDNPFFKAQDEKPSSTLPGVITKTNTPNSSGTPDFSKMSESQINAWFAQNSK